MNYEELYTLAAQVEERLQPVFREKSHRSRRPHCCSLRSPAR